MFMSIDASQWIDILLLLVFLVPISIIDIKTKTIPDVLIGAGGIVLFLRAIIWNLNAVPWMIASGAAAFLFLWLFYRFSNNRLGFGDVKLGFLIGAGTGLLGFWCTVIAAGIALLTVAGILLFRKKLDMEKSIPFAPFLCFGVLVLLALIHTPIVNMFNWSVL